MARQVGAFKVFRVGPGLHARAAFAVTADGFAQQQRLDHVAAAKHECRDLAFAPHRHRQAPGQRIRHAHTHAVQAATEAVGAARALVELAAGVQARENDFQHRHFFFRVQAEWDAAAVVFHAHRAVGMQRDRNQLADAGQGFVGRVVDHFLHDVQRAFGARVHAGALLDGLQALQDADRGFGVGGILFDRGHGGGF